jgi:creatinine amidohydrolase
MDRLPVAVLPPVWFGYTVGVLKNWPGTVTIKPKVLIDYLYSMVGSLIDMGFEKILIVNGHGNNPGVLDVVVRSIGDDYKVFPGVAHIFSLWDKDFIRENRKSKEGGIGHAGEIETSVMLHISDLVDMTVADDADRMKSDLETCPVDSASSRSKKLFLSSWYLENPTCGGLGDPSVSTSDFGQKVHEMTVEGLVQVIGEFHDIHGKLRKRKLKRKNTKF